MPDVFNDQPLPDNNQGNHNNQGLTKITQPLVFLGKLLLKKKTTVLVLFLLLLVVESVWAISFIRKNQRTFTPGTVVIKEQLASLTLDPQTLTTKMGDQFTVKVMVDTKERLVNGVDAQITYDPSLLTVVDQDTAVAGVQAGGGDIFTSLIINDIDPLKGKITLTASRLSREGQPFSGVGMLASLTFTVKAKGTTNLTFIFDSTKTNTSNVTESKTSSNILTTVNNATIQIQ